MEATRIHSSFVLILTPLLFAACSSRPCREPRIPELDHSSPKPALQTPSAPAMVSATDQSSDKTAAGTMVGSPTMAADSRVRVYKPDGSRQCEKNAGQSILVMERELAGIPVFAREKRKDGLMHVQVCGSPSGMINIYEIELARVKQAEERGFKRWEE